MILPLKNLYLLSVHFKEEVHNLNKTKGAKCPNPATTQDALQWQIRVLLFASKQIQRNNHLFPFDCSVSRDAACSRNKCCVVKLVLSRDEFFSVSM